LQAGDREGKVKRMGDRHDGNLQDE